MRRKSSQNASKTGSRRRSKATASSLTGLSRSALNDEKENVTNSVFDWEDTDLSIRSFASFSDDMDTKRKGKQHKPANSINVIIEENDLMADGSDEISWRIEGHEWIGQTVIRVFSGTERTRATCTKWAEEDSEGPALWHVVHEDGDEEDLEEHEMMEALDHEKKTSKDTAVAEMEHEEASNSDDSDDGDNEWLTEGHEWIGQTVIRVFSGTERTRATCTKWAEEDSEGPALWHVVHEDGDEEDLEEHEMMEALDHVKQSRCNISEETVDSSSNQKHDLETSEAGDEHVLWRMEGHEWIGKTVVREFSEGQRTRAKCTKWAEEDGEGPALWHVEHDDGDEEDLEEWEMEEALQLEKSANKSKVDKVPAARRKAKDLNVSSKDDDKMSSSMSVTSRGSDSSYHSGASRSKIKKASKATSRRNKRRGFDLDDVSESAEETVPQTKAGATKALRKNKKKAKSPKLSAAEEAELERMRQHYAEIDEFALEFSDSDSD